jgi:hypothetical protein
MSRSRLNRAPLLIAILGLVLGLFIPQSLAINEDQEGGEAGDQGGPLILDLSPLPVGARARDYLETALTGSVRKVLVGHCYLPGPPLEQATTTEDIGALILGSLPPQESESAFTIQLVGQVVALYEPMSNPIIQEFVSALLG